MVYLSLEGLVTAVKEGTHNMPTKSSNQLITDDSGSFGDASDSKVTSGSEEFSGGAVCNGNMATLRKYSSDGCIDICNSGYCVACLSGNYPIALDW